MTSFEGKVWDAIVIGAGPGGSTTASLLARHGLDVLLIDKAEFPRDKTCGDGLTPRAVAMLQHLGIEDELRHRARRIDQIKVFSPSGREIEVAVPDAPDLPSYMLTIPRLVLDQALRNTALASGAQFASPINVDSIEQESGLTVVHGRHLTGTRSTNRGVFTAKGRVAVLATGANLRLPRRLGLIADSPRIVLAARAYFADAHQISGAFEFHFDGVPLPGYGWIFPVANSMANVGVGIFDRKKHKRDNDRSTTSTLTGFLEQPSIRQKMHGACQSGPVKGFPIRTDFTSSRSFGPGYMAIGEAVGLVNPLTGEGIDYALESGKIAARHLIDCFDKGDASDLRLAVYDEKLRREFQKLFTFCEKILFWAMSRPVLNGLVAVAERRRDLRQLLTEIVLGTVNMEEISRRSLLRSILKL